MNEKKLLTLRIKKIYFNKILSGEKICEYREKKLFYDRIFRKEYEYMKLHYQGKEKIIVKLKQIKVIKNIYKKEERPKHLMTDEIYKIEFKEPFFYIEKYI